MSTAHDVVVGPLIPSSDVSWAVQIFSSADLAAFAAVDALLALALAGETVVVQHSGDGSSSFVIIETRSEPDLMEAVRQCVLTAAPRARLQQTCLAPESLSEAA
ncbi:hypothetical protein [Aeromicrobium halocynthiae]|uniref:hypothetical protein n=1 Tax=Aeromicrobium halocynthiae TaxID=560557 RepID=UPI0031D6B5A7